ncbi:MAG: tRNA 4-thiouridine(8) synthase ThiI [Firmicutes bacterium]|nr:tRNA 4-thiouridine(8) synthase ThiI [Bacillota bacterium]MCL2255897.1 tRNA 4-thiouridine(8) synthase ThiI [Bacillota bacterium]
MNKHILVRVGEIFLKGKNKNFFETLLFRNIKSALKGTEQTVRRERNRFIVCDFSEEDLDNILTNLGKVFGVHSFSVCHVCESNYESINALAQTLVPFDKKTFRVNSNRSDKRFPMNSMELSRELGGDILNAHSHLSVDLHNPDFILFVDVGTEFSYIYSDKIMGMGGMPVGTAGHGLLLLSGGIDSPVAAVLASKRGLELSAIHFHSYPYTSEQAKQKVIDLAKIISPYTGSFKLYIVSTTKLQEAFNKHCESSYAITLLRRAMMRLSEELAFKIKAECIINGESLGQVASQTIQSIGATNSVVNTLPVIRPLICFDKSEIIELAKKFDTYETSILPFEDCCTAFLPSSPVTRPKNEKSEKEEKRIPNYDDLLKEALETVEIVKI